MWLRLGLTCLHTIAYWRVRYATWSAKRHAATRRKAMIARAIYEGRLQSLRRTDVRHGRIVRRAQ